MWLDVLLSSKRNVRAARQFLTKAMAGTQTVPAEVVTDRAAADPGVLDELLPGVLHDVDQYANNKVEADHCRLKARLRHMRVLKTAVGMRDRGQPRLRAERASAPLRARCGRAGGGAVGR